MYETNHPDHRDNQRRWNTDRIEYRRNSIIVFDANDFKEHGRIWTYKVAERKRGEEDEGRRSLVKETMRLQVGMDMSNAAKP